MDSKKIQKYLDYAIKTLFAVLGLLLLLSVVYIESNKKSPEEIAKILDEAREMREILAKGGRLNTNLPDPWPPKMNKQYPEIELFDQEGKELTISSLKGKVLIVEYIDISSPISQAQSGAGLLGAYYASASQDIDKYAQPFSKILMDNTDNSLILPNENIIELKIIIYGENANAGSRDDAYNWASHFDLDKSDNVIVAVPKKDIRGEIATSIIGGYQLVDKNGILRVDSAGSNPKHNLKMTLVPLVPKLIR